MTQLSAAVVTDVLVVGAGPTGLMAAAVLARARYACIIVDAAAGPTVTSKAAMVHASTLELLDEIDAAEELVAAGVILDRIVVRDQGRVLHADRADGLPSRYPFALGVPQSTTEQVLLRRLAELGGRFAAATASSRSRQTATGTWCLVSTSPDPATPELRPSPSPFGRGT